jgi:hypothetical protein
LPEAKGPYIPVTLLGPSQRLKIAALVDSGADFSAIPKSMAEVLGLDLTGKPHPIAGVGGPVKAVESRMGVLVFGTHTERRPIEVPVLVLLDPSPEYEFFILGRAGFFSHFEITINERHQKVTLKHLEHESY